MMKTKQFRRIASCITVFVLMFFSIAAQAAADDTANSTLVERGRYLATAADCAACHTRPGGKPYAGGLPIPTPVGTIYATNITPSKTGIGDYSLEEFSNAVRKGIRADGAHLYPAMPYPAYAHMTDADIKALYAYFMNAVEPVDHRAPETDLPFPFNIRLSMMVWNWLFLDTEPYQPNPERSEQWNRGAYLTQALAHCGTCHTPRNMLMAPIESKALSGGAVGFWHAPNITSDVASGIGGWSKQELVDYLSDGHTPGKAMAAGPMAEAIDESLRHLKPKDLKAIATYLQTVPAVHKSGDKRADYKWGTPTHNVASVRGVPVPQDPEKMSAAQLYYAHCASCHGPQGKGGGVHEDMPSLIHNTTLGRTKTNNLVLVMLNGIQRPSKTTELMPAFADKLSNEQIAKLGNYLLEHFGNPNAQVTAQQVAKLRSGTMSSSLLTIVRVAMVVVAVIVVLVIVFLIFRIRRRRAAA